jgi:peptide-methionine (S)-S-oxide reductase
MKKTEKAIFAAGCFWGVQAVFDSMGGVLKTTVGYTGGREKYENPSYELVCSGKTGHAETVEIEFDPEKVSYQDLLGVFWMNHNPTTLNRQGPDVGGQYRSSIFYLNEKQKKEAIRSKEEYQKKLSKKIVTKIVRAVKFYPAESYHQRYYKTHSINCHVNLPEAK